MDMSNIGDIRPRRAPDFVIGSPDDPYMQRWFLIPRNDEFNVYYHRILRDDEDRALHDHPWPSLSIMTHGRLHEITPEGSRVVRMGDVVFRAPELPHRLELIDGQAAETLFITGPRVRDWGFHCPKGWVLWSDFVNPGDTGTVGRGCGEMA